MKTNQIVLAAALLGGLLSVSAFATTIDVHNKTTDAVRLELPVPAKVVSPVHLLPCLKDETVRLSLTIDAAGQPHNVRAVSPRDEKLLRNVISAVSQWEFTPARKNGVPVSSEVVLPLKLVES